MTSLAYTAALLGLLLASPLTDASGLTAAFLALAQPILYTGLIGLRLPALRELDRVPGFASDSPDVGSAQ